MTLPLLAPEFTRPEPLLQTANAEISFAIASLALIFMLGLAGWLVHKR